MLFENTRNLGLASVNDAAGAVCEDGQEVGRDLQVMALLGTALLVSALSERAHHEQAVRDAQSPCVSAGPAIAWAAPL